MYNLHPGRYHQSQGAARTYITPAVIVRGGTKVIVRGGSSRLGVQELVRLFHCHQCSRRYKFLRLPRLQETRAFFTCVLCTQYVFARTHIMRHQPQPCLHCASLMTLCGVWGQPKNVTQQVFQLLRGKSPTNNNNYHGLVKSLIWLAIERSQ